MSPEKVVCLPSSRADEAVRRDTVALYALAPSLPFIIPSNALLSREQVTSTVKSPDTSKKSAGPRSPVV